MTRWAGFIGIVVTLAFALPNARTAHADAERQKRARPWAGVPGPAKGPARAIGKYKAGCLSGGKALAHDGAGYLVIRPKRKRFFGHPALVSFIKRLGMKVNEAGLGELPISDLGQARGGPTPSGHASHQIGLDVDIWFSQPSRSQRKRKLSHAERKRIYPVAVVSGKAKGPTKHWSPRVLRVLKMAAVDARVARIFINPLIKVEACKKAKGDRTWLRKLRPWWGHAAHFHVRLHCPKGSPKCRPQGTVPEGDGCAGLSWWTNAKKQRDRKKGRAKYRVHVRKMPTLPKACKKVLR